MVSRKRLITVEHCLRSLTLPRLLRALSRRVSKVLRVSRLVERICRSQRYSPRTLLDKVILMACFINGKVLGMSSELPVVPGSNAADVSMSYTDGFELTKFHVVDAPLTTTNSKSTSLKNHHYRHFISIS
jgi:hypothetical protein